MRKFFRARRGNQEAKTGDFNFPGMIFGHTGLIEKNYPMPDGLFFNGRVLANEAKAKPIKKKGISVLTAQKTKFCRSLRK